jgi:ankyrin repeat protein
MRGTKTAIRPCTGQPGTTSSTWPRLLIDSGADVDARTEDGRTPLHWAALNKSLDMARLLIERGANTDGIDLGWMESQ